MGGFRAQPGVVGPLFPREPGLELAVAVRPDASLATVLSSRDHGKAAAMRFEASCALTAASPRRFEAPTRSRAPETGGTTPGEHGTLPPSSVSRDLFSRSVPLPLSSANRRRQLRLRRCSIAWTLLRMSASWLRIRLSIFRTALITVVWSLPPKRSPSSV